MPAAQGSRRSQRSQCQQKKLLSDQGKDRTGLYRLGTAAESLNPVRIHSCMHTAGFSEHVSFPWGRAAEEHSTVRSVQHAQRLHCVCYNERQRAQIWWEEEMRKKKRTPKETPVSKRLIRYSSSAFCRLNLYENLFCSSPCSRLLPPWLKPEWDVRM